MLKQINRLRKQTKKALKRLANGKGSIKDFNLLRAVVDKHFDILAQIDQKKNARQKK